MLGSETRPSPDAGYPVGRECSNEMEELLFCLQCSIINSQCDDILACIKPWSGVFIILVSVLL